MCSTFKFLLASAVLQRIDHHEESLDRAVRIPPKPLLSHSPLTELHAGDAMPVSALCEAILTQSDNTAANLLLETIGGPVGITGFARSIGDSVTRLDRTELSLNESLAGDPRDTTSPSAMVQNLNAVLLGDVLRAASRDQLVRWMEASTTRPTTSPCSGLTASRHSLLRRISPNLPARRRSATGRWRRSAGWWWNRSVSASVRRTVCRPRSYVRRSTDARRDSSNTPTASHTAWHLR